MAMWDQSNPVTEEMFDALRERAPGEKYQFTIGRYISRYTSTWKVITDAEWQSLAAFHAEMAQNGGFCLMWLIYEDDGTPRGTGQGVSDAVVTRQWISRLNVPVGGAIAYTSDEDGPIDPVCAATGAYFDGLRTAEGKFIPTRWLYASGAVAEAAFERGLIDYRWPTQSRGFSGTVADLNAGKWDVDQLLNVTYAGQDVDPDVLREGLTPWGVGCFIPGGGLYEPPVA
jgi:hypothetical protein